MLEQLFTKLESEIKREQVYHILAFFHRNVNICSVRKDNVNIIHLETGKAFLGSFNDAVKIEETNDLVVVCR
jgi:hypothetical protein